MNSAMKRAAAAAIAAVFALAGCAGSPQAGGPAPLWVADTDAAYPPGEWLAYTGSGENKNAAENAALAGLARIFRVDLSAVNYANEQFARSVTVNGKRRTDVSVQSREFAEELVSSSRVSGLIGVQTEAWTARDGRVYANARMNRRECSARYAAAIRGNENLIRILKEDAGKYPATFDAFETLNFAFNTARVTDNFRTLLAVLDPQAVAGDPEYTNAEAVQALARNAARSIVITVRVEGDADGRMAKAFGGYLTGRGFRTNEGGAGAYTLSAFFKTEDIDADNPRYKFVSYLLTYSVKDSSGLEVFSGSDSDREAHLTLEQARQRVLSAAESSVGSSGFAAKFDAYLESLL